MGDKMVSNRIFSDLENANAILNGQEDCCDEFVNAFLDLHKKPSDNVYLYDFVMRTMVDIIKINHSVLHIACGTAGYTRLYKNVQRFVGIDHSKKMIEAAKTFNKYRQMNCEFFCTTFENYNREEKFDIIYMGPYGHNVPYTYLALEKAKNLLKEDGMLFCTITDPGFRNFLARLKERIKQILKNKTLEYDPIQIVEKMFKKTSLETFCKMRIKTDLGHSFCYILKKEKA